MLLPRRHTLVIATTFALTGCVTSGTYDQLVTVHAETKQRLAEAQLDLASSDHELDECKAKGADLTKKLGAATQRGDDLDASAQAAAKACSATLAERDSTIKARDADMTRLTGDMAQVIKDKSTLKSSVDEMKLALDELAKRKAEADRRIGEYKSLLARFQALIDAGKLKVKIVDGRMVVALASDVLFPSGSASLSKDGKANVQEVAKVLAGIPDRKFQVEGHTDNVPIRTEAFPSNWELASARALTVLRAMVDAGLPADRVSAASFGESKPAMANDSTDGKAANRRIEIVVVPDLSSLPGFDELKKVGS